ncbi:MAG: N-acetylmuramoyl-L-alanine amidase [Lachnospiraceae bacterium]|nr:N-acetylmuramoyl-L-alanine amidase [Lachnospiraceae bacterium]
MRKLIRCWLIAACIMAGLLLWTQTAAASETEGETESADQAVSVTGTPGWYTEGDHSYYYSSRGRLCTGWVRIQKNYYYFRKTAEGDYPAGSMVTGFLKIGTKRYYFSKKGIMQTGWLKLKGKYYYFQETGNIGIIGGARSGLTIIDGARYYFSGSGYALTGWQTYKSYKYYFADTGTAGSYGKAYSGGWKKIGGSWYYFSKKGILQTGKWIGSYYVDQNGKRLKSTVTPDGWIVNKNGVRTKKASGWVTLKGDYYYYKNGVALTGWRKISGKYYYFNAKGVRQTGLLKIGTNTYYLDESGVRQTGWMRIDGKKYYFKSNGKMAVNTTVDGVKIGSDGKADVDVSVLLIAGHGQGDVGASSIIGGKSYEEYRYTREFATLIYQSLKGRSSRMSVTMYDQDYDCYKVVAGYAEGPGPNFEAYDYVLEVHFNATAPQLKDLNGDGAYKGVGIYINSAKKDYSLDARIVNAVAGTGFKVWGCGVFASAGLLNAKTCQLKNVSYGLLETAFIDDRDDMKFYLTHRKAMAKAVADTIVAYFGL